MARRTEAEQWEEDRKDTSSDGGPQGACQAAAHRASIQSALMLPDLQETALHQLDAQERLLQSADRKEIDRFYEYDRFVFDMRNYFLAASGAEDACTAGRCLSQRYADAASRRINNYRARHPEGGTPNLMLSVEEVLP